MRNEQGLFLGKRQPFQEILKEGQSDENILADISIINAVCGAFLRN